MASHTPVLPTDTLGCIEAPAAGLPPVPPPHLRRALRWLGEPAPYDNYLVQLYNWANLHASQLTAADRWDLLTHVRACEEWVAALTSQVAAATAAGDCAAQASPSTDDLSWLGDLQHACGAIGIQTERGILVDIDSRPCRIDLAYRDPDAILLVAVIPAAQADDTIASVLREHGWYRIALSRHTHSGHQWDELAQQLLLQSIWHRQAVALGRSGVEGVAALLAQIDSNQPLIPAIPPQRQAPTADLSDPAGPRVLYAPQEVRQEGIVTHRFIVAGLISIALVLVIVALVIAMALEVH